MISEALFFEVYGNMLSLHMADEREEIRRKTRFDPRALPAVRQVLDEMDKGGLPAAVVRTGMLIAKAGGGKRNLAQMARTRPLARSHRHRSPACSTRTYLAPAESRRDHRRPSSRPRLCKRSLPSLIPGTAERRKLRALLDALARGRALDDAAHDDRRGARWCRRPRR